MPKSRIQERFKVTQDQFEYINKRFEDFDDDTRWILCHILVSTLVARERKGWIPIPDETIRQYSKTKKFSFKDIRASKFVEVKDYSRTQGKCREFRLVDEIIEDFLIAGKPNDVNLSLTGAYQNADWVNLFNGIKSKSPPERSARNTNTNKKEPDLIREALSSIEECFYNDETLTLYYSAVTNWFEEQLRRADIRQDESQKLKGKLANLEYCTQRLMSRTPTQIQDSSIYSFNPNYEVQSSGRLYFPLQHAPRVMKQMMYQVEGLINYDVNACHARIALQLLKDCGLPHKELETYILDEKKKASLVNAVGITEGDWKDCFFAILNGAALPPNPQKTKGSIASVISLACKQDDTIFSNMYKNFREGISPIYTEVKALQRYLVGDYIQKDSNLTISGGNRYITNQAGKKFNVSELEKYPEEEKIRRFTSFILQGYEAAFIHQLVIMGKSHGYKPVANEHDGLIVLGTIPHAAIEAAERETGLTKMLMRDKPFCTDEELREFNNIKEQYHSHKSA